MPTDDHDRWWSGIQRTKKPSFHSTSSFIYPISDLQQYTRRCGTYNIIVSIGAVKNLACTIRKIMFYSFHHAVLESERLTCSETHNQARVTPNWVQYAPNLWSMTLRSCPIAPSNLNLAMKKRISPRRIAIFSYHTTPRYIQKLHLSVFGFRRIYLYKWIISGWINPLSMSCWSHVITKLRVFHNRQIDACRDTNPRTTNSEAEVLLSKKDWL